MLDLLQAVKVHLAERVSDEEYLAAVEAGDMEKAQSMVDEAAKSAGYDIGPVFHGTDTRRTTFDIKYSGRITRGTGTEWGFFFTDDYALAKKFAENANGEDGVVEWVYIKAGKIAEIESGNDGGMTLQDNLDKALTDSDYEAAHIKGLNDYGSHGETWLVWDSNRIKSADPVTYDDQKNIIPLSQRFNSSSNDIRY